MRDADAMTAAGMASGPEGPSSGSSAERRFLAKRLNEQIKAFYSLANTLSAAVIGAAYIIPPIKSESGPNELDRPGWIVIGLSIHVAGQKAIRFGMRQEERAMSLTWQLALGALAFAVVGGGFVCYQVYRFDKRFPPTTTRKLGSLAENS